MTHAAPTEIYESLVASGTSPALVWYDDDGRVELSGKVFANHVAKIANYLVFAPLFLVFLILFGLGQFFSSVWILINVVILAVSILTIIEGAKKEHLGILNFGLAIITLWIIIRFLNTDLSFIIRGLLLITIGVGFFTANYLMLKKRKTNG